MRPFTADMDSKVSQVARDTGKLQGQASTMHTKFDHPAMLTSST